MANPRVSPKNWSRVRGLTQIAIGTVRVNVENVSFSKRLEVMISEAKDETDEVMRFRVRDFKLGKESPSDYIITQWPEGVEVKIYPNHQKRPHRPYVPEEVVEKLESVVSDEYPQVPVEEYSFNDLLGLYLDRMEEYYAYFDCVLEGENYKGGAEMVGQ